MFFALFFALVIGPPASTVYMHAGFILRMLPLVGSRDVQLPFFFGRLESRAPSRLLAGLSQVLRERPDGAALREGFVEAIQRTVFPVRRVIRAALSDAAKYLTSVRGAVEVAVFPLCATLPTTLSTTC